MLANIRKINELWRENYNIFMNNDIKNMPAEEYKGSDVSLALWLIDHDFIEMFPIMSWFDKRWYGIVHSYYHRKLVKKGRIQSVKEWFEELDKKNGK